MYNDEELFLQFLEENERKQAMDEDEEDIYMQLLAEEDISDTIGMVTHQLEEPTYKPKEVERRKVICPYCKSDYVKRISMTGKVLSMGVLGLASSKIGKQWHCNTCKSDF